ncbi:MAG TPA: adenylate/guanylate cyclase domain-containing protein, partial [Candidatus Binatia bacterium]|nr:adenylate/guanylate cyclase domain-containing protein [Candidatus Binatia bacterium]
LLASSVTETIEVGMLRVRPDIVRRLIQQLKADLKQVRRINVYRRNGVEAFADLDTLQEVNRKVHLDPELVRSISEMVRTPGPPVSNPLFRRAVETTLPEQMYETIDGARVLTLFQPLRNLKECQSCHGTDHEVRGVLQISLGLESLDAQLRAARNQQIFVALSTIVAVTVTLLIAMGHLVLRPVARVAAAARRIGGGDFEARVPMGSEDEIGQLGAVINDMTARLRMAYESLAEKNRTLDETLHNLQDSMKRVELLEQLKNQLSKFVPESVKRMLEQNPQATELEQCEKDVSAIFLDIAGYTHLSEQMEAKQLNRLLQRYFSAFLDIIHNYHGDVNETAGDGLMVIFQNDRSSAEHALNAIRSALAIQRQVEELNREFAGIFNPVSLHMGINSGLALIGASKLTSSSGPRWIFTALGPVINIAARVAGEATAGEIFMTSSTAERVKEHFILERLGERRLKNVADPVQLYRLIEPGVYDRVVRAAEGSPQLNSAACSNYVGET